MIRVARGDTPGITDALVVRVGAIAPAPGEAGIVVRVADPALAAAITDGVAAALGALAYLPPTGPIVRLRARKTLPQVAAQLAGAIAIVPVTPRNARHLVELVDGIRAAGAAGVQLLWDGGERDRIERHVFAVLEHGRATPGAAPVVLASTESPVAALQILVAHRRQK